MPTPYAGPPLTVAYLGNFRHSFCTEVHVAASLESLGHTVVRLQEDQTAWDSIVPTVQAKGAQLFMWTRTWPSEKSEALPVLEALRSIGVPSAFFHLDRWHGLDREHQVHDQPFAYCDVIFSPNDSPRWKEDGFNHFWLPPGVYGPECEPVSPNPRRWPFDVVFVGSHPYPHPEWQKYRTDLLSAFRAAFGRRFAILPRERRGTPIRGRDLQELYATVPVILGDSCLAGESTMYWSDRVPETLGRGAALIHPRVPGMGEWYSNVVPEQDFIGYDLGDFKQAVAKARFALDDEVGRWMVGQQGRRTVLGRDTYAHRMGTVLAVAEGIYDGFREVEWQRSSPEVEREAGVSFSLRIAPHPKPDLSGNGDFESGGGWTTPATESLRVKLNRWSAVFEPRPGTTDAEVIGEVWWKNDYRVPPEGFCGTVVDIGANVGAFSVLAAKAGARAVYAVEPEPGNCARLDAHVRANGATGIVSILNLAMTGEMTTVLVEGMGGGARTLPAGNGEGIATITLEWMLDEYGPVEFLKCDVESAEYDIFDACPVEALAAVDRIALEFHGPLMPHLSHLNAVDHLERWGALVAKLADAGRVETFGHPMRGGLIWWRKY